MFCTNNICPSLLNIKSKQNNVHMKLSAKTCTYTYLVISLAHSEYTLYKVQEVQMGDICDFLLCNLHFSDGKMLQVKSRYNENHKMKILQRQFFTLADGLTRGGTNPREEE